MVILSQFFYLYNTGSKIRQYIFYLIIYLLIHSVDASIAVRQAFVWSSAFSITKSCIVACTLNAVTLTPAHRSFSPYASPLLRKTFQVKVSQEYFDGSSYSFLADKYNIEKTTLQQWVAVILL